MSRPCVRCALVAALLIPMAALAASRADAGPPSTRQQATDLNGVRVQAAVGSVPGVAASGTKIDTPLIETPQSISVVDQRGLRVRAVQNLGDAVAYSAGITTNATGTDTRYDWPYIRGFNAGSFGIYLDGLRFQPGTYAGRIEPYLLQRVEILKGPSSVLYGQNAPGGLINAVSKQPGPEPLHELGVTVGNQGMAQLQTDQRGALDRQGHWTYRLTAVGRDSNTQIDHAYDKRLAIAPALTWRPDADTRLTVLGAYQRDVTNSLYAFLPAIGTAIWSPLGRIPTSRFSGDTHFDSFRRTQAQVGYQFEHRIDDTWTLRQNARSQYMRTDWYQMYPTSIGADLRTLGRVAFHAQGRNDSDGVDTQAVGQFDQGAVSHTLLIGLDLNYATLRSGEVDGLGPNLDAYDPVYGLPRPALPLTTSESLQHRWQAGLYAQDQMHVGEHWVALAGLRRDHADSRLQNDLQGSSAHQTDDKTTWRAGMVYLASNGLAPYVSYSTSFLPNSGTDFRGAPFAPTTGRQWEGGIKYQPRDLDAVLTASVFDLHQANVLQADPAHPNFQAPLGEVRSRGAEFEGVIHPLPGWEVRAAYTYDAIETVKGSVPSQVGKRPTTVPGHLASLWSGYTLQGGALRGLELGGGIRYVGNSYGGTYQPDPAVRVSRDFDVPSYVLVDAVARYRLRAIELSLNVNNLADRHYTAVCYGAVVCSYGDRRRVLANATYHF